MTSVICQNFAGNAWRKDLCSNCFKSKEEHGLTGDDVINEPISEEPKSAPFAAPRYSAGSIQPAWKLAADSGGDLRSPQLLKTAFIFSSRVGNTDGSPKATEAASQPLSSSDESDSAVSTGSSGTPPLEVLPTAPKFTARFVDQSVPNKASWNVESKDVYRPRYSVSDFKQAYGAHAAGVDSRVSTLSRSAKVTPVVMSTTGDEVPSREESSSSHNSHQSSSGTSTDNASTQRVIIHKITKSILKPRRRQPKSKPNNVCFPSGEQKEVEVIGFGGDETYYSSDEEEEEEEQHVPSDDDDDYDYDTLDADATPDERRLKNVTDRNTNYNGNPSNLLYGQVPDENKVETVNPVMEASMDTTMSSDVSSIDITDTKVKETPKVSVKPFVQRQQSWQTAEKPSSTSTVSSWLYKQQHLTPLKSVDENSPPEDDDKKSFVHSTKVPVQHVAPMVATRPQPEPTDLQVKFNQIQRSFNNNVASPTSPKPPILKPKPKISPKPAIKGADLPSAVSHERIHDVIKEEKEDVVVVPSRHAQSMHDLLAGDVDSSFESIPTVSKSHDNLDVVEANLETSMANSSWENSPDADEHSTPEEPQNLPIISESSPIVIRVNATPVEEKPTTKPVEPSKFKKFTQSLQRSNSDLSSNMRREADLNLKNTFASVFSSKQQNGKQNSSTKRQAPQPPQMNNSPTPILKNYSKNGGQATSKQQLGHVERRSREKKSATLSPGTNGASVQFLLNPSGEFAADFRESSPSPTLKKKQRRSRSLPRPSDLFLTSETSGISGSKRKGYFSPNQEPEKLGKSLSTNEETRGRSTAKKKTKNFIMKLLKRGSSSSQSNNLPVTPKTPPGEKSGKSKYSFEQKEERKGRLQIVHPLDMRKKPEFGDEIFMGNGDYVLENGNFKLDVSNNNDIVVNRVLPVQNGDLDGRRSSYNKVRDDNGRVSSRDAMRLPGQTDVDLESTPVFNNDRRGDGGSPTSINGQLHASTGRPKPPPPPRSSSNKNRDIGDGTSYANLGGARQSIAPVKPERSNSIRDMSMPGNVRSRSKRESPGVEPPPPPVVSAMESDSMGGKERKASPYAITPCPNIDAPTTPPQTPPGGYNVPRPSALSIAQHTSLHQSQSSPTTRQPPVSSGSATAFIINQLRTNNYHHESNDEGFDDISGPSSLNIVIGAHNKEMAPQLSTFSSAPPPPPTSTPPTGSKQQVLGRSYASRLSLRGTASSRDSVNSHYAEGNGGRGGQVTPSGLGRSPLSTPVHKRSLEDNYGAVVAANHQALAQLLDQVQDRSPVPEYLKPLQEMQDLRWADFSVHADSPEIRVGKRLFVSGTFNDDTDMTLMMCGSNLHMATRCRGRNLSGRHLPFLLPTVRAFMDMLPSRYLTPGGCSETTKQGSVHVLPKMNVTSVQDFRRLFGSTENYEKAIAFLLLQMVSALKHLQAQGIEEVNASLDNFVITSKPNEQEYHLVLLNDDVVSLLGSVDTLGNDSSSLSSEDYPVDDDVKLSLCQSAVAALLHFLGIVEDPVEIARNCRQFDVPVEKFGLAAVFSCVGEILQQERAGSLTQVKSLLEHVLWGPDGGEIDPNMHEPAAAEKMIHQWLDLERAHVLNNLIRTQAAASKASSSSNSSDDSGPVSSNVLGQENWLTIFEEYQLMFLVRTSVKSLKDVMYLLASKRTLSEA